MSKHTTDTAAAVVSPKVKSAGVWGAVVVILGPALAAGILAIPKDAFDSLGVWALPVGVFVGALGASLAAVTGAYQKGDPLRNLGGAVADLGGTVRPATTEVEEEPLSGELPEDVPIIDEDTLTPEADALAAKAAELRRTGSTAGGV